MAGRIVNQTVEDFLLQAVSFPSPVRDRKGLLRTERMETLRALRNPALKNRVARDLDGDTEPEAQRATSSSSDDESSWHSASSSESEKKRAKKGKKDRKKRKGTKSTGVEGAMDLTKLTTLLATMSKPATALAPHTTPSIDTLTSDPLLPPPPVPAPNLSSASPTAHEIAQQVVHLLKQEEQDMQNQKAPAKIGTKVAFKRVDQVYDRKIHNYKLRETVQGDTQHDKWDQVILFSREARA